MKSAAETGAVWGEIDIQYTADFIPVLYHDSDLTRVSHDSRELIATSWEEIKQLSASHPERFEAKFNANLINQFTDLLDALANWPKMRIFVELKSEAIVHFGVDKVVDDIVGKINDANRHDQIAAIISKHDSAMEAVRAKSKIPIGWVTPDFNEVNLARAQQIEFDYLFINKKRFNAWQQGLPRRSEQRVAYTINDLETAQDLLKLGADMIETDLIGTLLDRNDEVTSNNEVTSVVAIAESKVKLWRIDDRRQI